MSKESQGVTFGKQRATNAAPLQYFDIYLPLWLARYVEQLFGTNFLASVLHPWTK